MREGREGRERKGKEGEGGKGREGGAHEGSMCTATRRANKETLSN